MIDISQIKEHYSQMTDEQIIYFARTEGKDITGEALDILRNEFLSRGLDTSVFGVIEDIKTDQRNRNIEKAQDKASEAFIQSIWTYAFDEKKNGTSNAGIVNGLMEKGLDESHSDLIVKTLESKAKEIVAAHDKEMLYGGIVCLVGLVITIWTYTSALNGGTYFVAWGAIIFGAIRFFRAASDKEKYRAVLANIQAENEAEIVNKIN